MQHSKLDLFAGVSDLADFLRLFETFRLAILLNSQ